MRLRCLWACAMALLPGLILAQGVVKHHCTYGSLERRIDVLYETADAVPCEVHYHKDTEAPGERQVLWRANNQAGYCEQKTRDFIEMLQESGWDCGEQGNADTEDGDVSETDASDTDVLAPAANERSEPEQ